MLTTPPREIVLSSITLLELEFEIEKFPEPEKRRRELYRLVDVVTVLPFGKREAVAAARIRMQLGREGRSIHPLEVLIAGTALAHNAVLVTRHMENYRRIAGIEIEDWY